MAVKYIFVTGGVVSGLGKGITAASLGRLLKQRGVRVKGQKVDPYLRPLYDGLFDMLGAETYERLVEKQIIEVAPLAYMRGRTLDDSFIILDEAQNTTPEQMKMFLTRMGVGSKVVVTGDVTQIDLPERTRSGLVDALHVLKQVKGIAQCYFTEKDVVRHRLVQEIIKAYDRAAHPEKQPNQKGED